jgi:peptidoglycan L-alanyl-D-glutamate endopeptidase CwlK
MPEFGSRSKEKLKTCDPQIQMVLEEAIKHYDFSILEGHRTEEKQQEYFKSGASKVQFPDSKHNVSPSMAVDVVPYPIDWSDLHRFKELSEVIKEACETVEVDNLNWGFDLWQWDMPHWEIRV